jgi:hypothetical protein
LIIILWLFLIVTRKLRPPLLAQALAGGGAPLDAGGYLLLIDVVLAFGAPHPHLVGEDFDLIAAVRALMYRNP